MYIQNVRINVHVKEAVRTSCVLLIMYNEPQDSFIYMSEGYY